MNSLPWTWIFWAVVCLIAIRLLLSHVYTLRDHLRDLLLEHFRNQMELAKKRQNILRMQAKIRERNQRAEAERLEREKTNQSVETSRKRAA